METQKNTPKSQKQAKGKKEKKAATEKVLVKKASERNAIERPVTVKERNLLYRYQQEPNAQKMPEKEHKKKRNKIRRGLQLLVNAIIVAANTKKDTETPLKEFMQFYKAHYITNDLTLKSITASGDELKQQDLNRVLELAKARLAKNK